MERLREEMSRLDAEAGGEAGVAERKILADSLSHEIIREREFRSDIDRLEALIARSTIRDVASLHDEARRVIFAHHALRHSPLIIHRAMTQIHRAILNRCVIEAGLPPGGGWSLMAAGALGRGEETCCARIIGVIISLEKRPVTEHLCALMLEAGLTPDITLSPDGIWHHGSLEEWQKKIAALTSTPGVTPAHCADLVMISGDVRLAEQAIRIARSGLARWKTSGNFPQAARLTGGMRLAIGFFGGFRIERSGPYRGSIDLDGDALDPLVSSVRLLAIAAGIDTVGTVDRVRELVSRGWLAVEPATHIIDAFHTICSIKGRLYGENSCLKGEHRYIYPDELSPDDQESLRIALETTGSLQRLMIQSVVGRR